MKRFYFSLEKILSLRAREEDQVRAELKTALSAVTDIEKGLEMLQERHRHTESSMLHERRKSPMEVTRILMCEEGLSRLKESILREHIRLKTAHKEADRIKARFREAKKKRESLEKIKEKHQQRYEAKARGDERKRLDEVAVNRFLKQRAQEHRVHERRS